jgi:hypothetical protein
MAGSFSIANISLKIILTLLVFLGWLCFYLGRCILHSLNSFLLLRLLLFLRLMLSNLWSSRDR